MRLSVDQSNHRLSHFFEKLWKWECQHERTANEDHIHSFWHPVLEASVRFAKPSPRPVPIDCAAHSPAHRKSYSLWTRPTTKPEQNKAPPFVSVPSLEDRLDIGRSTKPRAVAGRTRAGGADLRACLDGEALAALRAPTFQHLPAPLGFHPLPEAVRLASTAPIWLERPLHGAGLPRVGTTRVVY